jgi:porin
MRLTFSSFALVAFLSLTAANAAAPEAEGSRPRNPAGVETERSQQPSQARDQTQQSPQKSGPCNPTPTCDEKIKSIWEQNLLTGDWGGTRPNLEKDGVCLCFNYTGEVFSIVDGGRRNATIYEGLLELAVELDSKPLLGYDGGHFRANAFWLHGDNPADRIGMIEPLSNIEGFDRVRLYDFWYQQNIENDFISIRAGLMGADEEFFISQYAATFINGSFGWPNNLSNDLPNGGPNYPVIAPGLRLLLNPVEWNYLMAAVFTGDPGSETGNPHGVRLNFDSNQGIFSMFETGFKINQEKDSKRLPGTYKIGAWYHSGLFTDQRIDDIGLSVADPLSSTQNRQHRGNYGFYLIGDQLVYREPGTIDQGLGVFARFGCQPSDRNLVDGYVDGGINYKGLLPNRPHDVLGLAVFWEKISDDLRALDRDENEINAAAEPVRDYEMAIELTYQVVIAPWWTVQPDIQWILHPGGSSAIPDATVVGVRTSLHF